MSFKEKFIALFSENKEVFAKHGLKLEEESPIKLTAETELADGTKLYTDADSFAVGVAVYSMDEAGNPVPAAAGEYTVADGTVIMVDDSGKVAEMKPKAEDDMPAEEMMEQLQKMAAVIADLDNKLSVETEARKAAEAKLSETKTKLSDATARLHILEKKPAVTTEEQKPATEKKDGAKSTLEFLAELKEKQPAN